MAVEELRASYHDYLRNKVQPVALSMLTSMLVDLPEEIEKYMVNYLEKWNTDHGGTAADEGGGAKEDAGIDAEVEQLMAKKADLEKKKEALTKMLAESSGAPAIIAPSPAPPYEVPPSPAPSSFVRAGSCEPFDRAGSCEPFSQAGASSPDRSMCPSKDPSNYDSAADEAAELAKVKAMQKGAKRAGVSCQAVSQDRMKEWTKPVFEKPQEAKDKLKSIIDNSDKLQVLFGHLTDDAIGAVIDAMFPKDIANGESIIKQGDEGDCFYIIDVGAFDIWIARGDADPIKVLTVGPGACFGELALMYDAPRAATVTATEAGKVWALDRESFQMMLITAENTKKKEYEGFLEKVEILQDLTKYEMAQVSDLLESELFDAGETIITQGEEGDKFYIVEDGEAKAYIQGKDGEIPVKDYKKQGDYFGEIALLTDAPRKATVRATGDGCSVLFVRKEDFDRVLGPIKDILAKNIDKYPQYADMVQNEDAKEREEKAEKEKMKTMHDKDRREGVSATGITEDQLKNWVKPVHPKPAEAVTKLKEIIAAGDKLQVLFGHLEDASIENVIEAMFPKEISAGETVIKQGEQGDNFYIVDTGTLDVFIQRTEGDNMKVLDYQPGASFGELALMYNAPRAATVTANTDCKLWALDRDTFKMLLVTEDNTKKREYEGILEKVPILSDLTKYELENLSDKLESELFDTGEEIVVQDAEGDKFYIIEDGTASAYMMGESGEIEVKSYSRPGDYFGEIALLTGEPRKATIRATGGGATVLSMTREDFEQVLGPIKEQLRKKISSYVTYEAALKLV